MMIYELNFPFWIDPYQMPSETRTSPNNNGWWRRRVEMEEWLSRNALRSYVAEFISTFIFVFAAVGSAMSSRAGKVMRMGDEGGGRMVVMGVGNAFALTGAVYIGAGGHGHVNPAVTLGMAVGGHIRLPTLFMYWISQMLAATMASLFLKATTVSPPQWVPVPEIAPQMTGVGAALVEGLLTFGLVYTVYAAGDPRRGPLQCMGPLAVGLISGANVLAAAPFTGASMNPASSFATALLSGSFSNHAVYWVGPFLGASLAALLYQFLIFPPPPPPPPSNFPPSNII